MNRALSTRRAAALVMAALAMVLKLLLGPGLMPGLDTQGAAHLVICTGQGAKVIVDPTRPGHAEHKPCPFEGQMAATPVEAGSPLRLAAVEYPATVHSAAVATPGRGLSAPPPPATGPPSLTV